MTRFHRTSLNLYREDVEYLRRTFGRGWTEQLRDMIHQEIKAVTDRIAPLTKAPAHAK